MHYGRCKLQSNLTLVLERERTPVNKIRSNPKDRKRHIYSKSAGFETIANALRCHITYAMIEHLSSHTGQACPHEHYVEQSNCHTQNITAMYTHIHVMEERWQTIHGGDYINLFSTIETRTVLIAKPCHSGPVFFHCCSKNSGLDCMVHWWHKSWWQLDTVKVCNGGWLH